MRRERVQAVILIHGIGEQMPIQTLRHFIDAVWLPNADAHGSFTPARIWSKPDPVAGSVVLPRLSTMDGTGHRTDYFEFYWAHLMTDTKLTHVLAWGRVLLLRWPWNLPPRLLRLWLVLVTSTIAVFGLAVYLREMFFATAAWWSSLVPLAVTAVVDFAIIRTLGDAARYLHRTAQNTGRRVEILAKGVELLRAVHDSGRYDRVIVVGHSLGSVIGYDILAYTWSLYHAGRRNAEFTPTLDQLEKLATEGHFGIAEYQDAQRRYHQELRSVGNEWLVTDLITVGSPLRRRTKITVPSCSDSYYVARAWAYLAN
jgi:hypothetical protein